MTGGPPGGGRASMLARLPFYYGWVVVAVAFVTMGIGVSARTSFSLLYPPILAEFGWERGVTAGIYSVGFVFSMVVSPFIGILINRFGPGPVLAFGAAIVGGSLMLTTEAETQFELFAALGAGMVGFGVTLAYVSHSYLLPFWFARRRGLAIGIAFSGVGIGSITLFPWLQSIISAEGWRAACWTLAVLLLVVVCPLNLLFQRRRPEDLGLEPDGDGGPGRAAARAPVDTVVDRAWAERDWSLLSAARTARFWWVIAGYFFAMHAWYAVLIHQTKYLGEIGFAPEVAAYALGLVGLMGVVGQIGMGALSDRIGREASWTIGCLGFVLCYLLLYLMQSTPSDFLLWSMVVVQGALGYGLAAVYPSIMAELFHSPRFGQIFGIFGAASGLGAAFGPWITGVLYDMTGSYNLGWAAALAASFASIGAVWLAAPRKVRLAAGQAARRAQSAGG